MSLAGEKEGRWTCIDSTGRKSSEGEYSAGKKEGLFHNGWNKVVIAFIRMALCWTMCLGFIGLAHRYLTRPRPLVRYLADSAYWVYWIHLTVTFKLSFMAQQWPRGSSLLRSYVTLVLSTVICFWSYNAFVRYTWLGDYFMGRRKSRTDPGEADLRMSVLLRKVAPGALVGAGIALLLGQVLHFDRSFQGSPAHVAAIKTGVRGASASMHFAGILELLIEHGADPELRDAYGRDVAECLNDFGALARHPPR